MVKRQEDTDIDQFLLPHLDSVGVPRKNIKRNFATALTLGKRGDIWISNRVHNETDFEDKILALIECKDRNTNLQDSDWVDAFKQGVQKAKLQGLKTFFVSNTDNLTRCYNTETLNEIYVDGETLTEIPSLPILRAIQSQVSNKNDEVLYRSFSKTAPNAKQFRASLWNLRQTFRASGISKGGEDTIIKTTLSFCILKLISEKQKLSKIVPSTILLWEDWREGQMNREVRNTIDDLIKLPEFEHLEDCLQVDVRLLAPDCYQIWKEIDQYTLFNSDFDFFGIIYESFANKELKKDFGEFYTPRHIIKFMVSVLLKDEVKPREIEICDPACGTGGFLVEAFLFLKNNYEKTGGMNDRAFQRLKNSVFSGLDTNEKVAIPYARTNMMMAGDGGTKIRSTEDSLKECINNQYDYVLANIPYGRYAGDAKLENFSFTNSKRFELLFLEQIINFLKPGGKAAVIVPDSVVEATSYSKFRQNLLFSSEIEAIISLPPFTFEPYTTEKTYILFLMKKKKSDKGKMQSSDIWHYIVDNDGYKKGKKRYPINEDDLPSVIAAFKQDNEDSKCGFVLARSVNSDNFYNLCSEYYLRRPSPIEFSEKRLEEILTQIEGIL